MSELSMKASPSDLYLSIRGIKYAFHEALADLVDNCVDAESTNVWLEISKDEIIIADNGDGMSRDDLEMAITPWRAGRKEQMLRRGKRGKFGIGLKSASFSLGNLLEIHTKRKGSAFEYILLDLEQLNSITDVDHVFRTSNEPTDIFKSYCKKQTGTVIVIRDVNARKVTPTAIDSLKNLLGLVYYKLILEGDLQLMVNNLAVKSLDPLMRGLKKNRSKNQFAEFDAKTINVDFEGRKARFKLQGAYVGRGNFWTDEDKKAFKYFLKRSPTDDDSLKRGLLKLDEQGIYTLRNGRLITLGGWFGLASSNTLLHHNTCTRVLLEFDEAGDELMGLDNTKTALKIEESVRHELKAYVIECVNKGEELFRREGVLIKAAREKYEASKVLQDKSLRRDSALAASRLDEKRREANPSYDHRQSELKAQLGEGARKSSDFVQIRERLPYNNFWDYELNRDGEVLVMLNEQHHGYAALLLEDDEEKIRANIKYFIYTLALYESSIQDLFADKKPAVLKDLTDAFGSFRRWVSKHFTEF